MTCPAPSRRSRVRVLVPRAIPILAYHRVVDGSAGTAWSESDVTSAQFALQLGHLRAAGFRSITFADYLAYRRGEQRLPRRPVLITFDAGYRSSLEAALPVLQRFGFTAAVFLVADRLGRTNTWAPDAVQEPLVSASDARRMLDWGIELQSHTCTHPRLTRISRLAAFQELVTSRERLEDTLGAQVSVVAYPWSDYDGMVQEMAFDAGYQAGVTLGVGPNYDSTPLFELRRIGMHRDTSLARFGTALARRRT